MRKSIIGLLVLLASPSWSATITSVTNSPDPFDNLVAFPASQDTITVVLSANDDMRLGIYSSDASTFYTNLYADVTGSKTTSYYWRGLKTPIPAYATPDTLPYGTYLIRSTVTASLSFSTKMQGTGLVTDDLWDVAVDKNNYIYFCDQAKGIVHKIDVQGNLLLKINLTASPLSLTGLDIAGITVDTALNIFISDKGNNRITKLIASTNYTTMVAAWNQTATSTNPYGMGSFGSNIWLADRGSDVVREFDANGVQLRSVAVANAYDVAVDNTHYYAVEDNGADQVRKYLKSTNASVTNWNAIQTNSVPQGVAVDTVNSYIFATGYNIDSVYRYSLTGTGALKVGLGAGTSDGRVDGPNGIAVVPDSDIVVLADRNNNRLQMFKISDGSYVRTVTNHPSNTFGPMDLTVDADGNVFIACVDNNAIKKFNSSGTFIASISQLGAGDGDVNQPVGVAVDLAGNLYVADFNNNRVQRFNKASETSYTYAWQYAISQPKGMGFGPSDSILYVASKFDNSLYKLNRDGTLLDKILETDMENNPGAQGVDVVNPADVAVDLQGNIFIVDSSNGDIFKGTILNGSNLPSSYSWVRIRETFNDWAGIAVDKWGNTYVTDKDGSDRFQMWTPDGTNILNFGGNGTNDGLFVDPWGIALSPDQTSIWVADRGNDRIQKISIAYNDTEDQLVTIADPTGPPSVSSVTYKKTVGGTTLTSPLSAVNNTSPGDSGVTFVVTFTESMDKAFVPTVKFLTASSGLYTVSNRTTTGYTNGWLNSATNVWEGWKNIPTGEDGVATIQVRDAKDLASTTMSPNPNTSNSVTFDTETPMPLVTSPSDQSTTLEATSAASGTSEASATLVVKNYNAASGGSVISQQTGVAADGSGNWTANSLSLQVGDNYFAAVATDPSGNVSSETSPRVKITRANILPGTIVISPSGEANVGDSSQWTLTYTAASFLDNNTFLKVRIPDGWTRPQLNSSSQAGFVSVTAGGGTTLDATPLDIVNTDSVRINITSMNNNNTFALKYGHTVASGYGKIGATVTCGTNSFGTKLVDSVSVTPATIFVRGRAIGVSTIDQMPATVQVGQSDILAEKLVFHNPSGLQSAKVTSITFRVEKSGGTAVAGNRFASIKVKDGGTTHGTATPSASSDVTVTLSTPIQISAAARETVDVRVDMSVSSSLVDSTVRLKVLDTAKIAAADVATSNALYVNSSEQAFPLISGTATIQASTVADSIMVESDDIIPVSIGERDKNLPGLRLIFRHPTAGIDNIKITEIRIATTTPADPSTAITRKTLRRKGASSNILSSTSIETSSPLIFDLSLTPITITAGTRDTIDFLADIVSTPSGNIQFSVSAADQITAIDANLSTAVAVKGDGVSFPLASSTSPMTSSPNTPSGKDIDATRTDWVSQEFIEASGTDSFYVSWDNANIYFQWKGTDVSTAGDLFIYISKATGGTNTTWNYSGYGTHNLPSGFQGADYVFYYDNSGAKGLRDAASSYNAATFTGSVSQSGTVTEIMIPKTDLGSPDSLKIIPFIQSETSANIVVSMPNAGVGEFVRNPTGTAPMAFVSWIKYANLNMGQTPFAASALDGSATTQPTWTYDVGSGYTVVGLTAAGKPGGGGTLLYLSVDGATPKIICLDTSLDATTTERWSLDVPNAATPTNLLTYNIDIDGGTPTADKYMFAFCAGNNLYAYQDNGFSVSAEGWSGLNIGGTGSTPSRSLPPDGSGLTDIYAYVATSAGDLQKIALTGPTVTAGTSPAGWPVTGISANPNAGVVTQTAFVMVGCTNGNVIKYDVNGNSLASYDVGPSINERMTYTSTNPAALYVAPLDNNLVSLSSTATLRWTINLGATTYVAPYLATTGASATIVIGAGSYLKKVTDNATSASVTWTYQATGNITADPVAATGSYTYFSSDDKRHFAVGTVAGGIATGWPTTVLSDYNHSRIVVDGSGAGHVYLSSGRYLYRFPKL